MPLKCPYDLFSFLQLVGTPLHLVAVYNLVITIYDK